MNIGCVPYLNAKPLIRGLDSDPAVRLTLLPPSKLSPLLLNGRLDVALLPSFEVIRLGLKHVPGLAIASPGEAASVLLHLKTALAKVKVVALDRNSRTTNALTRILLERRYGLKPRYVTHDPADGTFGKSPGIDAAVTIGDASFKDHGFPALDLGAAWKSFTGVPFVFALWGCLRRKPAIERRLRKAAAAGRKTLGAICREHAARVGLTTSECRTYLTKNITFDLGPEELVGLKLFARYARSMGLIPWSAAERRGTPRQD